MLIILMIARATENNILSVKAAYTICTDRAKADSIRLSSYYNQSHFSLSRECIPTLSNSLHKTMTSITSQYNYNYKCIIKIKPLKNN